MKETSKVKEYLSVLFIYLVALYFYLGALNFTRDSGLFPRILSIVVIILNTIHLVKIINNKSNCDNVDSKIDDRDNKKLILMISISAIYMISMRYLGFVIGTIIFLPISMHVLGVENKKLIAVVSIITVFVIYVSFGILLKVPVPKGILIN